MVITITLDDVIIISNLPNKCVWHNLRLKNDPTHFKCHQKSKQSPIINQTNQKVLHNQWNQNFNHLKLLFGPVLLLLFMAFAQFEPIPKKFSPLGFSKCIENLYPNYTWEMLYLELHKLNNRATPEQFRIYKHAMC